MYVCVCVCARVVCVCACVCARCVCLCVSVCALCVSVWAWAWAFFSPCPQKLGLLVCGLLLCHWSSGGRGEFFVAPPHYSVKRLPSFQSQPRHHSALLALAVSMTVLQAKQKQGGGAMWIESD